MVDHSNTAGRYALADGPRFDCAVNAVERVLVALPEVHRAGTKGVPVAAIGGDAIRSLGALFIADLTLAFAPGLVGVFIGVGLWGLYLGLCRGRNGKVIDWLSELTADCPRMIARNMSDQCGARCPDLPRVL